MSRRLHSKRGFLISLLLMECAVFLVGGLVGLRVIRHQMASVIGEQVKEDNARYAEGLAGVIEVMDVGDIAFGSPGWARMQRAVEELDMPADGFACILDGDNRIVCHPELGARPGLRGQDLSAPLGRVSEESGGDGDTRIGQAYFVSDGVHYLATRPIAGTDHRLLVHQPAQGLVSASDAMTTPLVLTFIGIGGTVLLLSLLGSYRVARRYDHALEQTNAGLEQEVARRTGAHLGARNALIFGLAKLADSRDPDTGAHLERMCVYSELIARRLQRAGTHPEITDAWVRDLRLAAALHDIGKVGIADSALLKPGKLDPDERKEIERHPLIAADTLLAIHQQMGSDPLVASCVQVALYHHERWDGTGYPFRFAGEAIPLAARIVAVADVYDALTSKRVYKPAVDHDAACTVVIGSAGTHFDPAVVGAFRAVADEIDQKKEALKGASGIDLSHIFGD